MRFRFLAENPDGDVVSGEIDADSRSIAEQELKNGGFKVQLLQVCEARSAKFGKFFGGRNGVKSNWKYIFFEQLSMLMLASLPVEQCLSTLLTGEKRNGAGAKIITFLGEKISMGMSLSEAMICCGGVFSETESKTVRAAEKIGHPDAALVELAEFGKKMSSVEKKIKSALTYPTIVLLASYVALVVLMAVVVPKFEAIFASRAAGGEQFHWLTRRVINLCKIFNDHLFAMFLIPIVAVIAIKWLHMKKKFLEKLSKFAAKLPLFGKLIREINLNKFFRTVGMLMSFGVPIQSALKLAVDVVGDAMLRKSLERVLEKITHGENLSHSFRGNKFLAATDCGLIIAGEQSGGLAQSFAKIAEIYDQMVEKRLTFLTTLVEPIIILILAVVVGTIVVAMFLPMISIMQSVML
jgi:type IV pilus assembly protein PilC